MAIACPTNLDVGTLRCEVSNMDPRVASEPSVFSYLQIFQILEVQHA